MSTKKHSAPKKKSKTGLTYLPAVLVGVFAIWLAAAFRVAPPKTPFDLIRFGRLPVLNGGRVKPLDSVARSSLLLLRGQQSVRVNGETWSPVEWLADVLFAPEKADRVPVFQIDNPDVLGLMSLRQTPDRYFAFETLKPHLEEIERQTQRANELKAGDRSPFQSAILTLGNKLVLYQRLQNTFEISGIGDMTGFVTKAPAEAAAALASHTADPKGKATEGFEYIEIFEFMTRTAEFLPLPNADAPADLNKWTSVGAALLIDVKSGALHPLVPAIAGLADAYRIRDWDGFQKNLTAYEGWLAARVPHEIVWARREFLFNHVQPFYRSMILYILGFLLAVFSWLWRGAETDLNRSAYGLLLLAFAVHTVGLFARIIIQGRPPVTNLYSSAVFVGWAAVGLGIILERLFRKGVGSAVAAAIGFSTLLIAHHLANQGDTMEMMRAVLDSNFWLATHVVCITIGYSSTFLSGFLGVVFIARRLFDRHWNESAAASLDQMVYGIVCFSMFFSFLGTILGGIWADQSWGRFWGWDPKENGALMIVLWNAIVLHARWGRVAERRTIMAMVVFGNVVTALSWFGVNMLGIGLHSYGFMDKAFFWLMAFVASQLALMALAFFPARLKS